MVELALFHYTDRETVLHRSNPVTKILCLLICSITLSKASLMSLSILMVCFMLLAWGIRLPFRRYRKELRFFFMMGTIIVIARTVGSQSWQEPVEAIIRFATIVLLGIIFADTSSPDDIARGVGSALSRLPGVNGYRIGSTIELTIATIPLLFDVTGQISQARAARGERAWKHPVKTIVSYQSAVFELMFDRAQQLEMALDRKSVV